MKRFFSLAITIAVAIAYLFVPIVKAGGTEPTTQIAGHNLSLEDRVNIVYYVQSQEVPTDAEEGLLIWLDEPDLYAYGTEDYKITKFIRSGQYKLFYFNELAAKQMTVEVKAMSYIKSGDDIYCSELDSYSIAEYCNKKLSSTTVGADGTTTLGSVVKSILKYGAASQKYLGYNMDNLAWEGEDYTISHCEMNENGHLIVYYSNGTFADVGRVKGENGTGIQQINANPEGGIDYILSDGTCVTIPITVSNVADPNALIFKQLEDGTYGVKAGTSLLWQEVSVPELYNGIPVTKVLDYGFKGARNLEKVTLPESINEIGAHSFEDCSLLETINLPNGITSIGEYAFSNCSSLAGTITIPENVATISSYAFNGCESVTRFEIGELVTTIGAYAFFGCNNVGYFIIEGNPNWKCNPSTCWNGDYSPPRSVNCPTGDVISPQLQFDMRTEGIDKWTHNSIGYFKNKPSLYGTGSLTSFYIIYPEQIWIRE